MKTYFISMVCVVLIPLTAAADVVITREPPATPINRTEAVWNSPVATYTDSAGSGGDLAGRIKAGGTLERSADVLSYNLITDSTLDYTFTGGGGRSSYLSAAGYRSDALELEEQRYSVSGGIAGEKLGFDLSVGYDTSDKDVAGIYRFDETFSVDTELSTLIMPTLPITLTVQALSHNEAEDFAATATEAGLDVGLAAVGALGTVGFSLTGDAEFTGDSVTKLEESVQGAELVLSFPVSELLTIETGAHGGSTLTRYYDTENRIEVLLAGGSLAGVLTPNIGEETDLSITLTALRDDTWTTQEGPLQDPAQEGHEGTWSGNAAILFSAQSGLYADPAYGFGISGADVVTHDISSTVGWQSADAVLQDIHADGQFIISSDLNGPVLTDQKMWGSAVSLVPTEGMNIASGYDGSARTESGALVWNHNAAFDFNHDIHGLLLYGAAADLTMALTGKSIDTFSQEYSAHIAAQPPFGMSTMNTALREVLSLGNNDETHSLLEASVDIPILTALSAGYVFQWEWAALDEGENNGHGFRHESRFTLSGDEVPFDLTFRYALAHGYRGVRHDAESLLSIPIGEDFTLENRFGIIYDADDPEETVPFLLELSLGYAF